MKSLKIGNVRVGNRLFLAPMVDVTDLPYRLLCRKHGAAIAYTEMINIGAILHENVKTKNMMITSDEDSPLGIQITGRNVREFEEVIPYLDRKKYDLVDINCGCPSTRIIGNESGSYLLSDPEKIGKMIRVLKKADLNVTAKIRLGFKKNEVVKISKEIERAGADALTIHARLANQKSDVLPDWREIKKVRKICGIPIIGNGGVVDGRTCDEMLDIADGAMVAGAAIGNPLVFKQILHYLKTGRELEVNWKQRLSEFDLYLGLCKKYGLIDLGRFKWLGSKFLTGFPGASRAREKLMKLKDYKSVADFIKNIH